MVQLTIDTTNDPVEELEQTLAILQQAIAKRTGKRENAKESAALHNATQREEQEREREERQQTPTPTVHEETALDTPFIKITVKEAPIEDPEDAKQNEQSTGKIPSLNQLINDDSITEEELSSMFKNSGKEDNSVEDLHKQEHAKKEKNKTAEEQDETSYLEIVEYEEEK